MSRWLLFLPPLIFLALVGGVLLPGLLRDNPGELKSVFIDRPAPAVPLTGLGDIPVLTDADLRMGKVTVVNFWASWCPPCRAEHPVLKAMAEDGVRVAGINMMDDPDKAQAYLAEDGNPFFALATDPQGRNRVEWGVTAPPETFIIRGDGTVAFKFVGPLVGTDFERRFVPALKAALAAE
jgi:cytochrome c biogenesis protein CcmG, thiol:disulfide interchange protein DsbE